jgi:hypothetical protein
LCSIRQRRTVAVLVALRDQIVAYGGGDLVAERPLANVTFGFPHRSYPAAIGAFIGVRERGCFWVTLKTKKLACVFTGQLLQVGEEGFEPSHPFGHTDLNRARLPFRHPPRART